MRRFEIALMVTQQDIDRVTQAIVEFYQPERVYLFGSYARGDAGPDSDLDFLAVVPDETPREKLLGMGWRFAVRDLAVGIDVIPWRSTDFKGRSEWVVASLPATVTREGRLLYDARALAA